MTTADDIRAALSTVTLPDGRNLVAADIVRAVTVEGDKVRFVLEVAPEDGPRMEPVRAAAQRVVEALAGVTEAQVLVTAHAAKPAPPSLKVGGHPRPQSEKLRPAGGAKVIAIGSGKGGVGKSTLSANLAVALAQDGLRVGLLDADFYGPSQPRMMGVSGRPQAGSDGQTILPPTAHGVVFMSLGLMVKEGEAVVWRGPMLMGALQQLLGQVAWGDLDVLLIDLPPGTGDVQLTLAQRVETRGAIVVSTPQDVALIDARKAIDMFGRTGIEIVGLVENMSSYICPKCGHEAHLFGRGGAKAEAARLEIPFLGSVPLHIDIRVSGDEGAPHIVGHPDTPEAEAHRMIAKRLREVI